VQLQCQFVRIAGAHCAMPKIFCAFGARYHSAISPYPSPPLHLEDDHSVLGPYGDLSYPESSQSSLTISAPFSATM
jgi:hypothetical protein